MPTIPQYQGGSVVDALSAPQQSGLSGGMFQGQDLAGMASQALDNAANFFEDQQKIKDADAVNRAEVAFATEEQDFRAAMSERLGANAYGVTKDTEKWVQDKYKSITQSLENDNQRRAFELRFANRALALRGDAMTHESKQGRESYAESRTAQIGVAVNEAITDIGKMPASRDKIIGVVGDVAKMRGWTPEITALETQKHLSTLHTGIIKSISDPTVALSYFNEHQKEIDPATRASMYEQLKGIERDTRLQGDIDGMMQQKLPRDQAIAWARSKYSGQDEDEAVTRVKQRYEEQEQAIQAHNDKMLDPIRTVLGDALQAGRIIKKHEMDSMLKDIRLSSPELYQKAQKEIYAQNNQLESDHRARKAQMEASSTQKAMAWLQLRQDMINNPQNWTKPGVDMLKELKPMVDSGVLNASHVDDAIRLQSELRNPKTKEVATLRSTDEYLKEKLMQTRFEGKWYQDLDKKEQDRILANARQSVDNVLRQFDIKQGEDAKIYKAIDSAFVKGTLKGNWFRGDEGMLFLDGDKAGDRMRANLISEIPPNVRNDIISAYRTVNKRAPTNAELLEYYNEVY